MFCFRLIVVLLLATPALAGASASGSLLECRAALLGLHFREKMGFFPPGGSLRLLLNGQKLNHSSTLDEIDPVFGKVKISYSGSVTAVSEAVPAELERAEAMVAAAMRRATRPLFLMGVDRFFQEATTAGGQIPTFTGSQGRALNLAQHVPDRFLSLCASRPFLALMALEEPSLRDVEKRFYQITSSGDLILTTEDPHGTVLKIKLTLFLASDDQTRVVNVEVSYESASSTVRAGVRFLDYQLAKTEAEFQRFLWRLDSELFSLRRQKERAASIGGSFSPHGPRQTPQALALQAAGLPVVGNMLSETVFYAAFQEPKDGILEFTMPQNPRPQVLVIGAVEYPLRQRMRDGTFILRGPNGVEYPGTYEDFTISDREVDELEMRRVRVFGVPPGNDPVTN